MQWTTTKCWMIDSGGHTTPLTWDPRVAIVEGRSSVRVRRLTACTGQLRGERTARLSIGEKNRIERARRVRCALVFPRRLGGRSRIVESHAQKLSARLVHRASLRKIS